MEMNLLSILFFLSSEGSEEIVKEIWKYLQTFNLPNARMTRIERDDLPYYCPPYMFFVAGMIDYLRKDNFERKKF